MYLNAVLGACCLAAGWGTTALAQSTGRISDRPRDRAAIPLTETLRLGALDGKDAFGGLSHVALGSDGRLIVLDNQNRTVSLYDAQGRLVKRVGRRGQGPGEFELLWHATLSRGDSVFVWDLGLGRMSVFSPGLDYVRSFKLPGAWNINSMSELPSGEFLLTALDTRTRNAVHIISRAGAVQRSFALVAGPSGIERFQESLLGGYAVALDSLIVFSHKSPYRLDLFDLRGKHLRSCEGSTEATTSPDRVVEQIPNGTRLHWKRFVHTTALLTAPSKGVVFNLIIDPEKETATLDAVDMQSCALVQRSIFQEALFLRHARDGKIAGFVEGDFPQVVLFRIGALRY